MAGWQRRRCLWMLRVPMKRSIACMRRRRIWWWLPAMAIRRVACPRRVTIGMHAVRVETNLSDCRSCRRCGRGCRIVRRCGSRSCGGSRSCTSSVAHARVVGIQLRLAHAGGRIRRLAHVVFDRWRPGWHRWKR